MKSPMDAVKIQSAYSENAKVLAAFKEICRKTSERDQKDFCSLLGKALATSDVYFTYGKGNIAILDAADFKLLIAYSGSPTGS